MDSSESWWNGAQTRVRQGVDSLAGTRDDISFPLPFIEDVAPAVIEQWDTRSAFDRVHMRNVAIDLAIQGVVRDVILAGLLHDIGKPAHARTATRAMLVILSRMGPKAADALIQGNVAFPGLKQLRSLAAHAEVGAAFLARHGAPERVVWLVRHHHDQPTDQGLLKLQSADDRH